MKIALIGYGKMGQAIEKIALERNHEIILKIDKENEADLTVENLKNIDVAIEFTNPEAALKNILFCLNSKTPIVSGSTGWQEQLDLAKATCLENETAFITATNYSLGVNLFFELNKRLAQLMQPYPAYNVRLIETHHTQKKDAPSGTAITMAEQILAHSTLKKSWSLTPENNDVLQITALRENNVPGTHEVIYESAIDNISLIHTAHNRAGFALGAVIAAEYIHNKKGVFTMKDVLGL